MAVALWAHFPVSGVETWLWLPPLVAFVLSFFSSMVGISGAFLLSSAVHLLVQSNAQLIPAGYLS